MTLDMLNLKLNLNSYTSMRLLVLVDKVINLSPTSLHPNPTHLNRFQQGNRNHRGNSKKPKKSKTPWWNIGKTIEKTKKNKKTKVFQHSGWWGPSGEPMSIKTLVFLVFFGFLDGFAIVLGVPLWFFWFFWFSQWIRYLCMKGLLGRRTADHDMYYTRTCGWSLYVS